MGFQILVFNIFGGGGGGGVRKMNIFGGMTSLWIFFGVLTKLVWFLGLFLCMLWSFLKAKVVQNWDTFGVNSRYWVQACV